jgi:peptide/nickel transport system substrate-binding protein
MTSLTAEQWENRSKRKTYSRHILATGDNSNDHALAKGEKFRRMKYLDNAYLYIGYNQRNELFADKRVRQAMTMLCNRQRIVNELYRGLARVISGPFFCDSPYYNKNILPLPFDPARAKALLAEAGWRDTDGDGILDRNGKKFVFTSLIVAGSKRYKQLMEIFKEDLAAVGIDMKIVPVDWNVYLQRLNSRSYDMCCLGWSLPYESDPYQVWHSSQIENQGSNHISFSNPRADKLIEDIRKTFDTNKRIRLCHEFHQLIHDEQPYTFLLVPEALTVVNGKLQNIRCFPAGISTEAFWIKE